MTFKFSVLVVANRTAGSDDLLEALRALAERRPTSFTLLVPAEAPGPAGRQAAQDNLEKALEKMRAVGLEVTGRLGDSDPVAAVRDAWDPRSFDEVIVSTLPTKASKWLQVDLPHRVAKLTGVQVTHVVALQSKKPAPTPVPPREKQGVLTPLRVLSWGGAHAKSRTPEEADPNARSRA